MRKNVFLFTLVFILLTVSGCSSDKPISKTEFMLGTVVKVQLYDTRNEEIFDKVFKRLREIENRMSVNILNSDINNINKKSGIEPVKVNNDIYYVLKKAKTYARISNGAFDPTIGPLVNLWGIGGEKENIPTDKEIEESIKKVDYNKLNLQNDNYVFLEEKGMMLDLGGIAKGYAADEINRILTKHGVDKAIIDLGGNIYSKGSKEDNIDWKIGIQNPFQTRGKYIGIIKASNNAVVTSGDYERYFEKDGIRYHHILDSETGRPIRNNVKGVSVIAESSIQADALSTILFALGVEKGLKFVEEINDTDAIFITKNYEIYLSSKIKGKFELINDDFTIVN